MVLVRVVLAVIHTGQKKVKGAKVNLIQKRDTAIIPIKNPKVVAVSPIRMVKVTIVLKENMAMVIRNPRVAKVSPTHMEKAATVPRAVIVMAIRNPKVAKANPTHMEKAATVPRAVIVMATRNPKAVEANPTHMGKTAMAIRAVMENLMDTKKDHPTEGMEVMVRVPLNMSCIINTN